MKVIRWNCQVLLVLLLPFWAQSQSSNELKLENGKISVRWSKTPEGWKVSAVAVKKGNNWIKTGQPSGEYTLLFAAEKPSETPDTSFTTNTGSKYPEKVYKTQQKSWSESTNPVSLNKAGQAHHFFPEKGAQQATGQFVF